MNDKDKTKAQLLAELAILRQQAAQLEQTPAAELAEVSAALHSSLNLEVVLDNILKQMKRLIPSEAVCVLLVEKGLARVFRWQGYAPQKVDHYFSLPGFSVSDYPVLLALYQSANFVLVSAATEPDSWIHGHGKEWVKSHLGVALVAQEQVIGFLNFDSREPGFFSAAHVELARRLAGIAAQALANAHLYDAARQENVRRLKVVKMERKFVSAVLDTTNALVVVLHPHGRILRVNRAFEQLAGPAAAQTRGKFFWDLFVPSAQLTVIKTALQNLQLDQLPAQFDSFWLAQNNNKRLIAWSISVLRDHHNRAEYIISTGIDLTERKQLEERLLAIHQLGRELNLLRDEVAICTIALETANFLLPVKSSGYGVVDGITGQLNYTYFPQRGSTRQINRKLPLETAARRDFLAGQQVDAAAPAAREAWLTAPMQVRERIIGVLDIERQAPAPVSADDQQLLQTLADQTAVAIENARLHFETQKRVDELTTVSSISQAITATLNLEKTLSLITNHAIRLMEAVAASVVLVDESRGDLWFHSASGGVSDVVRGRRLQAGQGIVGWVVQHGQPVLVPDVAQDPRFYDKFDQMSGFKTSSVVCVPLKAGAHTIGAIEVMNKVRGVFTADDVHLLSWLAPPAAIAITNARLFESEHATRERTEKLQEATATLISTLDPELVLNRILVQLEHVVPFDNATIFLQRDDRLLVVARRGVDQSADTVIGQYYVAPDNEIYQQIRQTGHPVILNEAHMDNRFRLWGVNRQVRSWMGIPLKVRNKVTGCLTLDSRHPGEFDPTKSAFAQAFANQAAAAIQNAQLFEQVRSGHKQLQSLSRRLVEVQESERRLIARELHDEAGQALTSLMVGLRLLEGEAEQPQAVISRAAELKRITNEVSENLHRLARDLRPASLDYLGLVAALRQYIKDFGVQHNLAIHLEAIGFADLHLPATIEINLYRIVQEALTNVVRHSQATRVDIFLERQPQRLVIVVEDNGIGFDKEAIDHKGRLGLLGMRERTEMLTGMLAVESKIGNGTTIYVEVPYAHTDSHR